MKLSVIITTHNDNEELQHTICSLFGCQPTDNMEVIVVDDGSTPPATIPTHLADRVKLRRIDRRIGVGAARHAGAELSTGEVLFFTDSHMRFPGTFLAATDASMPSIPNQPGGMLCGRCCHLTESGEINYGHMYSGATWNLFGTDRNAKLVTRRDFLKLNRRNMQVFETVWAPTHGSNMSELSAVMGACYFINRDLYFRIRPLQFLRSWGGDEQALSLKCWLAGGTIRLASNVIVGHKFKKHGIRPIEPSDPLYNKLFLIHTCLEPEYVKYFTNALQRTRPDYRSAFKRLIADWHLVETERAHNQRVFTRTFGQFLEHFGFRLP